MAAASHDHDSCIREALAAAARICAAQRARLTRTRRRVLELVWSSHRAVKTYEILDRLGSRERPAKPPTVYRALEFLIEHGLVHRVDSLNAYVGCVRPGAAHHGQLLICGACGEVAEIDAPSVASAIAEAAAQAGFEVQRQTVELRGL